MSEMCSGVRTLVARMESNPEEFFGEATKWRFMFNANFREVLTEPEKGALHEALKEVRRKEFDTLVLKELLKEKVEDTLTVKAQGRYATAIAGGGGFGLIGSNPASALTDGISANINASNIQIGQETLTEEDIKRMKAATKPTGWFR